MVSFKALKNTLFCLISHCDHISIETIMFVLSTDMCASIKGTQLPNVSCGSSGEWLFTPQPSGLLQKVPENQQMAVPAHEEGHWREVLGAEGVKPRKMGTPVPAPRTTPRDRLLPLFQKLFQRFFLTQELPKEPVKC